MPDAGQPVTREEFTNLIRSYEDFVYSTNQSLSELQTKSNEVINGHNGLHDKHDLLVQEFFHLKENTSDSAVNKSAVNKNVAKWLRVGVLTGIVNSIVLAILLCVEVGFIIYQQSSISDLKTRQAKQDFSQQEYVNQTNQQLLGLDEDARRLDNNINVMGRKLNEVRVKTNLPLLTIDADTYEKKQ